MTEADTLQGRRLLVVEDEYFLAEDIVRGLEGQGAEVVGPAGTIDDALDLIEHGGRIDGAVIDLNLHGEMAFPIADALAWRGVPFVFATGYDRATIPPHYENVMRCEKPVETPKIAHALFG